jgi:phosphatidyl-myo-inositol dimannoside synthase
VAVRLPEAPAGELDRPGLLVLSDVFPPRIGGSGRWLWELYRRLPRFDVTVLAGGAPADAEFDRTASLPIERLTSAFPSWGLLSPRGLFAYARAFRQLRAAARRETPQAVHCGKALPEGLLGLLHQYVTGVPYWCYAHGEELGLARTSRELGWLAAVVLRRAARVVANSCHTRSLLVNDWALAPEKIVVLTPGVDTECFVPAAPDPAVRAALGWTGRTVILTVGALQPRKGQDMLIRALPEIRRRCSNVLYAVAGEGWERKALGRLVTELDLDDAVSFLGVPREDELVRLYQQCDLFALPNRQVGWDFEGFGIVLLEAQACGKPVVTGQSGGTSETVRPGETGEVVACDDPAPLAVACLTLLEDPARRAEMGARGRAWVVERFDWHVLARQASELFGAAL